MSDDHRWGPMNFHASAEDYYKSALCIIYAQTHDDLSLHFPSSVPYYLFSHAVELALKGFLRAKGVSKKSLKNCYSHNFRKLIIDSIALDLPLNKAEHKVAIGWLEEYAKEAISFRYVRSGWQSLTDPRSTASNVKRILDITRPACEEARERRN
jgi:hypothetical protein